MKNSSFNSTKNAAPKGDTFIQSIIEAVKNTDATQWEHFAKDFTFARPYNPVTKTYYSPLNAFRLTMDCLFRGYTNFNFITFKQLNEAGGSLKKGSKAMFIDFTTFYYYNPETKGRIDFQTFKLLTDEEKKDFYFKRIYKIFPIYNFEQIEDLSVCDFSKCKLEEALELTQDFETDLIIEQFVEKQKLSKGLVLKFGMHREAFYNPLLDFVEIPSLEIFKSKSAYYSTLLHEITHWTGHKSRLNRFSSSHKHTKEKYSFEELVAELGALFLCNQFGIFDGFLNSVIYLKGWLQHTEAIKNATDSEKELNIDLVLRQAFSNSNKAIKFLND